MLPIFKKEKESINMKREIKEKTTDRTFRDKK